MKTLLNLETAVQGDKVMQDFELESLTIGGEHSQKVKAPPIVSDYGSKDCVNLSPSTAVSRLNIVRFHSLPILKQLQWEEALLRADQRNWCLINQGSTAAIVMGISGSVETLINQEKLKKVAFPLIRRFSGGGTVIVDQNTLFVTLVCQKNAQPIHPYPQPIMEWIGKEIYAPIFENGGFSLIENDFVLNEKKWGGNAQSIVKERWLHHTSILWNYCEEQMETLFIPQKAPQYRNRRKHADFLCRLSEVLPCRYQFEEAIIEQLSRHFTLVEKNEKDLEEIAALPHRKTTCKVSY